MDTHSEGRRRTIVRETSAVKTQETLEPTVEDKTRCPSCGRLYPKRKKYTRRKS